MPSAIRGVSRVTSTAVDAGATPVATGATAGEKRPYHFTAEAAVRYDAASNKWLMKLPNTTLTFDRKPVWLASLDAKNAILDRCADPARLHAVYDELRRLAESAYDSTRVQLDPAPLTARLAEEGDRAFLGDLLALFKIALDDETRSTFQYGGAMAGARCSEMQKLGGLVRLLGERLAR